MARKLTYHAGIIDRVERTTSSKMGNPAWYIHFQDGRSPVRTQTDASIGYMIDNAEWRDGGWVRYGVTPAGRMVTIEHMR